MFLKIPSFSSISNLFFFISFFLKWQSSQLFRAVLAFSLSTALRKSNLLSSKLRRLLRPPTGSWGWAPRKALPKRWPSAFVEWTGKSCCFSLGRWTFLQRRQSKVQLAASSKFCWGRLWREWQGSFIRRLWGRGTRLWDSPWVFRKPLRRLSWCSTWRAGWELQRLGYRGLLFFLLSWLALYFQCWLDHWQRALGNHRFERWMVVARWTDFLYYEIVVSGDSIVWVRSRIPGRYWLPHREGLHRGPTAWCCPLGSMPSSTKLYYYKKSKNLTNLLLSQSKQMDNQWNKFWSLSNPCQSV